MYMRLASRREGLPITTTRSPGFRASLAKPIASSSLRLSIFELPHQPAPALPDIDKWVRADEPKLGDDAVDRGFPGAVVNARDRMMCLDRRTGDGQRGGDPHDPRSHTAILTRLLRADGSFRACSWSLRSAIQRASRPRTRAPTHAPPFWRRLTAASTGFFGLNAQVGRLYAS